MEPFLTPLPLNKMAAISPRYIDIDFREWNVLYFDQTFTEVRF